MAYLIRAIQARRLKRQWKLFLEEKIIGLNMDDDESFSESSKGSKFKQKLRKWQLAKLVIKIKTPNTVESIVWESFLGFMGGVLLTYLLFFFFHLGVNTSLRTSTYVCGLTGIVLSFGLAFSYKIRCYVLLLLPFFFSMQGRQALLTYALFLAFTGPGKNTMRNMEILSDSMTCGQEMVKRTIKQINDVVKAPTREAVQKSVKSVEEVAKVLRKTLNKINRIIITILNVFKTVTQWLENIVNLCKKKVGTPFQRCMQTFDDAIADCKAKLGLIDFLCHVVHIAKDLCYTVKCLDFICLFTGASESLKKMQNGITKFHRHMKNFFYVSVEFNHSYKFETTPTKSRKVGKTILQKLSKMVEKLQTIFSLFGFVFSLFFLFLFLEVYYYRYKYLSSDRYDNVYISSYIVDLDIKRAQMDRETVLPLEPRENKLYAKPSSIRLLKVEKTRIGESIFLLSLTSFKIITFLFIDYSLFWILIVIYGAGRDGLINVEEPRLDIRVDNNGILANFYRKLDQRLQVPENPNMHLNPLHCLPDPVRPDIARYTQIGVLVALCWLLTITEAYGLRLRNVIMSHYHPHRARERAIWLYNHIIRSRSSFVRLARRQLRRRFRKSIRSAERVTFSQRLFARFPLFGRRKENNCLLCGRKWQPLKRCRTPDCEGRYCPDCFGSLENVCTICQYPMDYGDVSDISEELDSSEEGSHERFESSESESSDDDYQESEQFMTFKEMEIRNRFRDVEANKFPDYVKLGDLYSDKAAVQRRLKAAVEKRLRYIEKEKERTTQEKESEYQKVRQRLKSAICKVKNKNLQKIRNKKKELKKKFLEKIYNLRKLKEKRSDQCETEELFCEDEKPASKRFLFKLYEEEKVALRKQQRNYVRLKNALKAKIESLKRRKMLRLESLA